MLSKKWIDEYKQELTQLTTSAMFITSKLKNIFKDDRVIITYRVKNVDSLAEKIKRNKMEKNQNQEISIFEILDDAIGIRIVCMKNEDEKNINKKIKKAISELEDYKISFSGSFDIQPVKQKNGHDIYKIKGKYDKYLFELQIKSLANLFWGEMEHLLIYKNNRFIISNSYYKKEMESIHEELSIIDSKLSYMEDIMINENEKSILNEKKDVFKRYAYLNLRSTLRECQGEELNNNYIYDGIANYIFKEIGLSKKKNKPIDKEDIYNKIMLNSFDFLLDRKKISFKFEQFDINQLEKIVDCNDEIVNLVKNIVMDKENGWWYFIIISAMIGYNKSLKSFEVDQLNIMSIKDYIKECIEFIVSNINRYMNLKNQIGTDNKNKLPSTILYKQIEALANNKDLRVTDIEFLKEYNYNGIKILRYIIDNIGEEKLIDCISKNILVDELVKILCETGRPNSNITEYVGSLNKKIKQETGMELILYKELSATQETITYKKLFDYIYEGKEGDQIEE